VFAPLRWVNWSRCESRTSILILAWSGSSGRCPRSVPRQVIKKPKTVAGVRTVALPMWLVPELEQHFSDYSEQLPDGRVFVGPTGVTPGRPNFSAVWARALTRAGLSVIHVHDLRHTGNHLAAISGASTRELMGRMGHVSVNAALVYQHRTASRDRAIADSLDAMVQG
jgi:integrase